MKSTFTAIFRTNSAALRSVLLSVFALFIFSFAAQSTEAATITVNSLSDAVAGDGQCTLREAMTNANADDQSGSTDCVAGAGADVISISVAGTINLLSVLPVIATDMTINGLGATNTTVRRDSGAATEFRIFGKNGGNATFSGMTVRDGVLRGVGGVLTGEALGGGIRNDGSGTMTLSNVVVTNNQAIGTIANAGDQGNAFGGGIFSRTPLTIVDSTISGNTVTGGNGTSGIGGQGIGGGICSFSILTITNSTFSGNSATGGNGANGGEGRAGAVYYENAGAVTMTNSVISGNSATGGTGTTDGGIATGGGIFLIASTNLTINNSSVAGNSVVGGNGTASGQGGGINNNGVNTSSLSLNNSTVSGNTTSSNGGVGGVAGGIANFGTANITGSTVSNNTATRPFNNSGGIQNLNALNITNSTISGNVSSGNGSNNGGGIRNLGTGTTTLNNVTITDNTAFGSGSASGVQRTDGTINVKNSIIAGNVSNGSVPDVTNSNTGTSGSGFVSQGYNLIGNVGAETTVFSQTGDQTGTSAALLNPLLAVLANNGGATQTHRPLTGSPAIDKGAAAIDPITTTAVTTDQRGVSRPFDSPAIPNAPSGNGSDIGAYEFSVTINLTVTKTADTNDTVCDADCSLREALDAADGDGAFSIITFNIPANSAGCNGANCTITLGSPLAPLADSGNLTTINGAAGANTITLSGNNATQILNVGSGVNLAADNLNFTRGSNNGFGAGGGAISNSGTLSLTNSALYNNSANLGGAIYTTSGSVTNLTNVTISGNSVGNSLGGGIYNDNGAAITATNCTITKNTAQFEGGVLNGGSATFTVRNTIIADNTASFSPDAQGNFISQGYNLIGNASGANGFTQTGDQTGVDARLAPLGNYGGKTLTHALLDGGAIPSPAINTGTSTNAPTTDQRGAFRVGTVDKGAFELSNTPNGGSFVAVLPVGSQIIPYPLSCPNHR